MTVAGSCRLELAALEAIGRVQDRYGIHVDKPCLAWHLDGNQPLAEPWHVPFVLAVDLRRLLSEETKVRSVLQRWAGLVGYPPRRVEEATRSAFRRSANGEFCYRPPGLTKKPGSRYHAVLTEICAAVHCPEHCPAFLGLRMGAEAQGYERFVAMGWPQRLTGLRHRLAAETYRAICTREEELRVAAGTSLFVTHAQLAARGQLERKTIARHLLKLESIGLILYEPGSGARGQRRASKVQRLIPIPTASSTSLIPPIRTRDAAAPDIGDTTALPDTDGL